MSSTGWALLGVGTALVVYFVFIFALIVAGRRTDARAVAGFVPDCIILLRRLLADSRISGWRRATILALIGYLVFPIDLVPDFIPVVGLLDDAILAALVLRIVLRGATPEILQELWPGAPSSLARMQRLVFGRVEDSLT